jgi:A/G-specific adenine glycosylase
MTLPPLQFQRILLAWFDKHGRKSLPWQLNKTPYRVWISEIMLQQTQVSTVIPYFERFIQRFPDLQTLANGHENDVLYLWAGLGYYSRARNLHCAAKLMLEKHHGEFPSSLQELVALRGIGPSTAGAILAIAFNQPATILDGNVKRVLARLHGIEGPINTKLTENSLWKLAILYTPQKRVADYTQAMMDLGATLCTRSEPACHSCPFMNRCIAYEQGLVKTIPAKKASQKIPTRSATFLIFKHKKHILLHKRPPNGIWGGLYSLPEIAGLPESASISNLCQAMFKQSGKPYEVLASFRHTFTHYHLDIFPVMLEIKKIPLKNMEDGKQIWYNLHHPDPVGLPKPIQTILRGLL